MAMSVDKQEILDLIRVQSPRLELISFDAGKSEAWRWFKRVRVDGRVLPYAVCNGCLKPVHYTPRDGTGGLRRHACALTMAMQSQGLASSTNKTQGTHGHGQVIGTANGSSHRAGERQRGSTSLSDVTRNLVASRKNSHNLGRDLSSYHQLEQAQLQTSISSTPPPTKRSRGSKNRLPNPSIVSPSLMLWAAQQGLVDLASTASLASVANMDLRSLLPVSSMAGMASMASTMASLNAKYSAVMAGAGGTSSPTFTSPFPLTATFSAQDGGQRERKDSGNSRSRRESGQDAVSPNERNRHGHGNGSNSASTTPCTTPVPSAGNPSSYSSGNNVPKSFSKISDIALDLAHKISAESSPMNLSQDYMSVPTRRPRKRSHPDRAVPSASSSTVITPEMDMQSNGNHNYTVQVPQHHSYSNVRQSESPMKILEAQDYSNNVREMHEDDDDGRMSVSQSTAMSLLRLSLQAKKEEPETMDAYQEEVEEQKQPLDLQKSTVSNSLQVIPGRSSDVKVEPEVPFTQQSSSSSNLGALIQAHLLPPMTTSKSKVNDVHLKQISTLTEAIETLLPVPHDKIKRELSLTPTNDGQLVVDPAKCQELSTLSTSSTHALNELLGQLSELIQRHKKLLSTLEPSEAEVTMPVMPEIQKPAPQFRNLAVVDGQFKEISLSDYAGKYVVLFFYPLDFTFVCPTEIIAFSDRAEEFRKIGCEVIACSTDSHFSHLAWVNTPRKQGGLGSMNIPLLADKATTISKAYGVYKEDEGLTFRGLFIIDDKQRLRQITVNDLPVGRSVDETLRLVQAFQFTDKHGEVCPAGWTPGSKSMKADPTGSKEYFEGQH